MISVLYIIPVIVTIVGYLMNKYPPKKVNWFVGYRTRKSMKDEDAWKLANEYCGKLWIRIGLIMIIIVSLLVGLIYFNELVLSETVLAIITLCQIIPLLFSAAFVENKLKKN